ncbi:MAG: hypothetical protein EBU90_09725 [Proteobacteria bacterium]|nr:hypothetical protein [Pseudomonadota bacterium]NBP14532.1 hypothetical protein [bacterium]
MKKAFIITSIIEVDNQHPLTYSSVRSHFTTEERLRQTCFTVSSIDSIRDPDIDIYIIDLSDNYEQYAKVLGYQRNLYFIGVKKEYPEIYNEARTHNNKSHCETLLLKTFIENNLSDLQQYDYICKISGRYFIDSSFNTSLFDDKNTDKLFFKSPLSFDWNDNWPYQMVDRRAIQKDNKLYQYSSVAYAWGKDYLNNILNINRVICSITGQESGKYYDVETLLYYFTREYEKDIIHVPWLVNGWDGVNGRYLRY